jgi:hypothetical protein
VGGLIGALGAKGAIQAWRGPQAEEHDFGLAALDVEVKTTTSEHRVHWIESLTQLVPTRDRPLWLISHQVTTAGTGHGHTLSDLVDVVRTKIGTGGALDGFDDGLSASGWREDDRERHVIHWTRRTESLAYPVVDTFPRLTPDALRRSGLMLDRIPEVRYRVDLDGLAVHQHTPSVIATAIGFEG